MYLPQLGFLVPLTSRISIDMMLLIYAPSANENIALFHTSGLYVENIRCVMELTLD